LRLETSFPDGLLNAFVGEPVRSAGSTHHIFFEHDTTEIIGAGVQA